jgi:hypothetical protein
MAAGVSDAGRVYIQYLPGIKPVQDGRTGTRAVYHERVVICGCIGKCSGRLIISRFHVELVVFSVSRRRIERALEIALPVTADRINGSCHIDNRGLRSACDHNECEYDNKRNKSLDIHDSPPPFTITRVS